MFCPIAKDECRNDCRFYDFNLNNCYFMFFMDAALDDLQSIRDFADLELMKNNSIIKFDRQIRSSK